MKMCSLVLSVKSKKARKKILKLLTMNLGSYESEW